MTYSAFSIAIRHPFGPHGREGVDEIIERKRREMKAVAFCSYSPEAIDPAGTGTPVGTTECQSYRFVGQTEWQPWPSGVRVPRPFRGRKREASAFVDQRVIYPIEEFSLSAVQWFSNGEWKEPRIPTRDSARRLGSNAPSRSCP